MVKRLIVALDTGDLDHATRLARSLQDHVGGFKVGLELLMAHGPAAIRRIADMGLVFADAKLHDIPNTVQRASTNIAKAGARWVTIHAAGGREMIEAANQGMGGDGVLAVTVLTSMDRETLSSVGVADEVSDQVRRLAEISVDGGAEGIVCSPLEARLVKSGHMGLTVFTPGVRPVGVASDDQRRFASPTSALEGGADYLVVGRPITQSEDPVSAAATMNAEIDQVDTS